MTRWGSVRRMTTPGTSSWSARDPPAPRRRWAPSPATRACACCCSTGPTSRATSPAATASPRTCSTCSRAVGAGDVVDGWDAAAAARAAPAAAAGSRAAWPGRSGWSPGRCFDARLVERAVAGGRRRCAGTGSATVEPGRRRRRASTATLRGARRRRRRRRPLRGARRGRARPAGRRALAIRGYAPTPADAARQPGDPVRRPPPAVVRLGLRPRRRPVQRGVRRAARPRRRPAVPARCCSTSSTGCCPAPSPAAAMARPTTCRCRTGAGDQPDGPVLLAGDAAGLVNPMTGEGIYYAVATGVLAGRAAARAVAAGAARPAPARPHRAAVRALLGRAPAAHLGRLPARPAPRRGRRRHPRRRRAASGSSTTWSRSASGGGRITPRLAVGWRRAGGRLRPPRPHPRSRRQ